MIMIEQSIAIVGMGLMGGSLALALRPYLRSLTIVDTDPETLVAAEKLADVATANFAIGVHNADLVILATPGRTIVRLLAELAQVRPDGCMVLDMGSTKREICQEMDRLPANFQAIGGHPMCGKETAGFGAASPHLFHNQTFLLCRNGRTRSNVEEITKEIISRIGARALFLPSELHDELVAAISHLPYLAAATLMRSVAKLDDQLVWQVSASGFRDTVRLAGSDPQMMLDILLTNRLTVLAQLEKYRDELADVADLLRSGDEVALEGWLKSTLSQHVAYRKSKQER
jgi:prephenate dehydrogenase